MRQFTVWEFTDGRRWLLQLHEPRRFCPLYGFNRFVKELPACHST